MQQIASYIQESFYNIYQFNDLAGNLEDVDNKSIERQLSYIEEELTETFAAFDSGDKVELLDGACDLWVTVVGLLQKLESLGYNVKEAMQRVDENNLTKFPKTLQGLTFSSNFTSYKNDKYQRYVIKDYYGKVRKYDNFPKVDLLDLVPKEVV